MFPPVVLVAHQAADEAEHPQNLRPLPLVDIPGTTGVGSIGKGGEKGEPLPGAQGEAVDAEVGRPPASPRPVRLVDVGGGRGDLSNAVAAYFAQPCVRRRFSVHVTVVDSNGPSLEAGRDRAAAAGLSPLMSFVLCDLSDKAQTAGLIASGGAGGLSSSSSFDLVFGLHCCGGLAEAAVELAVRSRARAFCVSTCCFRSYPSLASLTRNADVMIARGEEGVGLGTDDDEEEHGRDRDLVSSLAVVVGGRGQHRAIRAMNAMRLVSAEDRFSSGTKAALSTTSVSSSRRRDGEGSEELVTWQEAFPVRYSVQNRVMIGRTMRRRGPPSANSLGSFTVSPPQSPR